MAKLSSRFTPINDEYGTCERTEATLAIYDLDPELVTKKLNIIPTYTQKLGVPRIMHHGVERIAKRNSWLYSSEGSDISSKDLRIHLNWLLDKIESVKLQLREIQQIPGVKMAIRCGWWSKFGDGGPTLWPEQMKRMAKLNLEWTLSFVYQAQGIELID